MENDKKFTLGTLLWLFVWGALAPTLPAAAAEQVVTVTGVGFIQGNDKAAARDQALRDAQSRAVEQVAGVMVDSRTALHKSLLIDDTLLTRSRGCVRDYRIVSEGVGDFGLYTVEIEARVDDSILQNELAAIAGEKKIILVHRLYRQDSENGDVVLADRLLQAFQAAGFKVRKMEIAPDQFNLLDDEKIVALANSAGCDLVLTGQTTLLDRNCPVKNMCAVRAGGRSILYDGRNGRPFARSEAESVRGYGSSAAAALTDAWTRTAAAVVDRLAAELFSPTGISARIELLRLPDHATYRALKRSLSTLRWVTRLAEDAVGFHPNRSVFLVSFAQEAEVLAGMLKKLDGFELSSRSAGTFVLEPTTTGRE